MDARFALEYAGLIAGDDVSMGKYLDKISGPADLKLLPVAELEQLAEEIRQFILRSVSKTGGHLASNLGAVELTLALHYVFDFQRDKLLWDVGHQCYTHKIITGRKAGFELLRRAGGISGFPNPTESAYDQFIVGHAGTSIATAIGMALGEQLKAAAARKADDGQEKTEAAGGAAQSAIRNPQSPRLPKLSRSSATPASSTGPRSRGSTIWASLSGRC